MLAHTHAPTRAPVRTRATSRRPTGAPPPPPGPASLAARARRCRCPAGPPAQGDEQGWVRELHGWRGRRGRWQASPPSASRAALNQGWRQQRASLTSRPRAASANASWAEKVDLPTPPLPDSTSTTCFTARRGVLESSRRQGRAGVCVCVCRAEGGRRRGCRSADARLGLRGGSLNAPAAIPQRGQCARPAAHQEPGGQRWLLGRDPVPSAPTRRRPGWGSRRRPPPCPPPRWPCPGNLRVGGGGVGGVALALDAATAGRGCRRRPPPPLVVVACAPVKRALQPCCSSSRLHRLHTRRLHTRRSSERAVARSRRSPRAQERPCYSQH